MSILEPLRQIVGRGVLLAEKLTRGEPVFRSAEDQATVDQSTKNWAIYEYKMCPFCMKLRKVTHQKALNIELRDARHDPQHRDDLLNHGGKAQVPCLRISNDDGSSTWMYESSDIIDFLHQQIPEQKAA